MDSETIAGFECQFLFIRTGKLVWALNLVTVFLGMLNFNETNEDSADCTVIARRRLRFEMEIYRGETASFRR